MELLDPAVLFESLVISFAWFIFIIEKSRGKEKVLKQLGIYVLLSCCIYVVRTIPFFFYYNNFEKISGFLKFKKIIFF